MKTVVFGFLGTKLDGGTLRDRWEKWRPTISLCQQEGFTVDRLELLTEENFHKLNDTIVADVERVSPGTEVRVHNMGIKDPWDFERVYGALADLCAGYEFESDTEYLAHVTTGTHVAQICLFLLTEARYFPGKLVQTSPPKRKKSPNDKRRGRPGPATVIDLDLSKYDRLKTRFAKEQAEARDFLRDGISTRNTVFNELIDELEVVALRSKAPILLTGPTGAGKSQLARKVYELREQRTEMEGEFVEVNCATLRGDTAMSTLFGHKKGAFTGAVANRPGVLRQAHGGLLFLDEIGELGLDEQAMLLRALEEGTFLPVGADTMVKSKFQLIAGTNRDLAKQVAEGEFREDLLARINMWSFDLPGLAQRREDIEPNLEYELRKLSEVENRAVTFNKEAWRAFLKFAEDGGSPWHGNFRDLNAAVMRMATLAERGRIRLHDVEGEVKRLRKSWQRPVEVEAGEVDLAEILGEEELSEVDPFDRVQLAYVVGVCQRSRTLSEAGREVFCESRKRRKVANDADRLKKYLAKFGLTFDLL